MKKLPRWVHFANVLCSVAVFSARAEPASPDFSAVSSALLEAPRPNAWSMPHWGFSSRAVKSSLVPKKIAAPKTIVSKSLIFDRSTDAKKIRPRPHIQNVQTPAIPALPTASVQKKKITAIDILNSIVPAVKAASAPKTGLTPVPTLAAAAAEVARVPFEYKQPQGLSPKILVIDEETLMMNEPQPLAGAEVHWLSMASGVILRTKADGTSTAPYPNTISARFVVTLPGYLPAVGYVAAGTTTPVVLYKESRIGPILRSLGVVPDPERVLMLGKILQPNLEPAAKITLDASIEEPFKVFYSIGSFGLFHPAAKETGAQGDFLISGMHRGLQYLMPSDTTREWPSWIIDTSDLPPFVTTTLTDIGAVPVQTQVVDSMKLERPDTGIHMTIGGQRGLFLPDEEGFLKLDELHARGSSDVLELRSDGYVKSWVNGVANAKMFPPVVSLFTSTQLKDIFVDEPNVDLNQGLIFGNLRPERFIRPVAVSVFSSAGRKNREALIYYFDSDNRVSPGLHHTDPVIQNFAVANLAPGEWHVLLTDPETGKGIGLQTVRVEGGTVSQVQF